MGYRTITQQQRISYVRATPARATGQPSARGVHLPYLPGLDGLRAIAVLGVLLYHADLGWFRGGFLGVEVFFVISGYLITSLLLAEWEHVGRIDLKRFWFRRARRLLPAAYFLAVAVLTYAVLFLPHEVAGLRGDALAAFAYVTNWYLIFGHKSYFVAVGRPSLLQHLWSLAVEEQFYLLWPPLLLLGLRYVRRARLQAIVLAGAVISALLMALLYRPEIDPSRIYYGTDTRAAGLLFGAALAFVWVPSRLARPTTGVPRGLDTLGLTPLLLDGAGIVALAALVGYFLQFDQYAAYVYRGGFALVALTTIVVIAVVVHPRARIGAALLGRQPLKWIGLRSYSIYLWHWPVYMVTRPQLDVPLHNLPLLVLRFALTAALAEFSYRCIETPIRSGALGRVWRALRATRGGWRLGLGIEWACVTGAALVFATVLGVAVAGAQAPPPPAYLAVTSVRTSNTGAAPVATATGSPTPVAAFPTPDAGQSILSVSALDQPTPMPTLVPSPTPVPTRHVTAIGDSVMVGAAGELGRVIENIDIEAEVGLQSPAALQIIKERHAAGQLGDTVIIHIGDNGYFPVKVFDDMMHELRDVKKVVFINVKVPRQWEGPNNQVLSDGVKRYPNAVLVDWHGATANRPGLFWDDGIHLRPEGAKIYASLVSAQVNN